ncbi:MAG: hypothetical protein WCH07_10195 [Deltaproteobacteria bacterium]
MKKFWIVMLAAGLFMAFTMPAIAAVGGVDVKFNGTLRMRGWYDDNATLLKPKDVNGMGSATTNGNSQAFYDNRLRVGMEFKVAEGLKLVTRFDALEKKWGQSGVSPTSGAAPFAYTGAAQLQADGISFERAYVDFNPGIGSIRVGYQDWSEWGTLFGNSDVSYAGIKYIGAFGPATVVVGIEKRVESKYYDSATSLTNVPATSTNDRLNVDMDVYDLGVIYKFTGGEAGVLWQYVKDNTANYRGSFAVMPATYTAPYTRTLNLIDPYVKFKSGPVYVEAEGLYAFGKWAQYDTSYNAAAVDQDLSTYGVSLNAEMDFKPFYAGVKFVYLQGDDPATQDKKEGSIITDLTLGNVHNFALMYGNYEFFNQIQATGWAAKATGVAAAGAAVNPSRARTSINYGIDNTIAYQGYVGMKPTPKLDVFVAYSYINAQTKPQTNWISDNIGQEFDLRATYKIFDNLSYTIGAGYFFTGDYFKGSDTTAKVDNDYLLMHQLMLSF